MSSTDTILVVDDDEVLRNRLEKSLARRGWTVFTAEGFNQAIEQAKIHQPSRAVLDLKMPDQSGLNVLREIREVSPNTQCVILTGYGSINNAVEAVKLGAVGYITKPAHADQVLAAFEESLETSTPEFPPPLPCRSPMGTYPTRACRFRRQYFRSRTAIGYSTSNASAETQKERAVT